MKPFTLAEHEQWMLERHGDSRNQIELTHFEYKPGGIIRVEGGMNRFKTKVTPNKSIGYYKEEE